MQCFSNVWRRYCQIPCHIAEEQAVLPHSFFRPFQALSFLSQVFSFLNQAFSFPKSGLLLFRSDLFFHNRPELIYRLPGTEASGFIHHDIGVTLI